MLMRNVLQPDILHFNA